MANAKTLPYPMVSALTKLDVISKPSIEVFPLSTTIDYYEVSYKVKCYMPYRNCANYLYFLHYYKIIHII